MQKLFILLAFPLLVNAQATKNMSDPILKSKTLFLKPYYKTGDHFPEVNGKTIDDETLNSSSLGDTVLVLNCWFSECTPCVAEIPGLNELKTRYKNQKVVFWAVTFDGIAAIRKSVAAIGFTFKQLPSSDKLIQDYFHPFGYPTTYIIKKGILRYYTSGGKTGPEAGEEIYEKLDPEISKCLGEN